MSTPSHLSSVPASSTLSPRTPRGMSRALSNFSNWFMEKHDDVETRKMRQDDRWMNEMAQVRHSFEMFGGDLSTLWSRFEQMSDYEKETLSDLRDRNVSIADVIDYVRAEPGFNAEGKPVRTDVASALRRKEFLEKSNRIESSGRSAALAAGAVAMLGIATVAVGAGFFPALAPAAAWIPKAWALVSSVVQAAAGGGVMLLAWKGWKELNNLKQGVPRLELGSDASFSDLPNSLGNMDYERLNEQYESIPVSDQHLIKHLSSTELRMFFAGKDTTRLHLLRANPPSAWAKIQSRVEPLMNGQGNVVSKTIATLGTIITAPWNRERNNARIPDLKERLVKWREFAQINQEFTPGDEILPEGSAPNPDAQPRRPAIKKN